MPAMICATHPVRYRTFSSFQTSSASTPAAAMRLACSTRFFSSAGPRDPGGPRSRRETGHERTDRGRLLVQPSEPRIITTHSRLIPQAPGCGSRPNQGCGTTIGQLPSPPESWSRVSLTLEPAARAGDTECRDDAPALVTDRRGDAVESLGIFLQIERISLHANPGKLDVESLH